jgi:hypothetical protein
MSEICQSSHREVLFQTRVEAPSAVKQSVHLRADDTMAMVSLVGLSDQQYGYHAKGLGCSSKSW